MIMRQSLYDLEIRDIWLRLLLCMLGPNKGDLLDVTLVYDEGLKKCHRSQDRHVPSNPVPFGCLDEKEEEDNAEMNADETGDNADDG